MLPSYTNEDVDQLAEAIKHHSHLYYNKSAPTISDSEFDDLVEKLRTLDPEHPALAKTGWGHKPESEHLAKRPHSRKLDRMLGRIKYDAVVSGQYKGVDTTYTVMPKCDGGAVVAYYNNRILSHILSRGDGDQEAFDITANLRHAVPATIDNDEIEWVRGEVVLTWDNFNIIGGTHPRNVASGMSQSINNNPEHIKLLEVVVFSSNLEYDEGRELDELRKLGFNTVPYTVVNSWNEIVDLVQDESKVNSLTHQWPTDGLVFRYGQTEAIAFKFKDETARTKIIEIQNNLSRTGRIVPVAIYETVFLSGGHLSRTSLDNWGNAVHWKTGVGAVIDIVRSNMIIPRIVEVIEGVDPVPPTHCPSCDTELQWTSSKVDLVCTNEMCSCRVMSSVWRLLNLCKVDGIGGGALYELVKHYNIESWSDVKKIVLEDTPLVQLYGPGTASKMVTVITNIMEYKPNVADILYLANISKMGEGNIYSIAPNVTGEEFVDAITKGEIPSEWSKWATNYPGFLNLQKSIDRLQEIVKHFNYQVSTYVPAPVKVRDISLKYAITGKGLSKKKSDFEAEFHDQGYELVRADKADILVMNINDGSAQYKTAVKRGIPIMSEDEFRSKYGTADS